MRKTRIVHNEPQPRMPAMTDDELNYLYALKEDGEIPVETDPWRPWPLIQVTFATIVVVCFYGLLAFGVLRGLWICLKWIGRAVQ